MDIANPILVKEMRTRMRGGRSFAVITVYAATLGVILGLFYWAISTEARSANASGMGQWLASAAIFVQMALICLISPTFAASAISSEREQQTFELLVASLANPMTILAGKVGGALCYLFLVLFGSLPIVSFIYWVGGVSILDVAVCYVIMLVSGVAYCTLSFFWSTLFRRGVLAQMVSVFSVIFLVIGIPAFAGFLRVIMEVSGAAAGWSDFWDNVAFLLVRTNPFYAQGEALWSRSAPPGSLWLKEVPAWMFLTGFYGALTLLAGLLAWLRLRSVRKWLT